MLAQELLKLIGKIPDDKNSFKHRMRVHQGWWRAFVLAEPPGKNPADAENDVCNTILNGSTTKKNFLTSNALKAYELSLQERNEKSPGMMNEDRVWNNLLSSQPLCFNFFGELKTDLAFASEVLRAWIPSLQEVTDVRFEYAPDGRYTDDNSAFDIAFFYRTTKGKRGVFGLECKYTDDFSKKEYSKDSYRVIFNKASKNFCKPYEDYIASDYNQLFRNQLIAETMLQNNLVDEVITGLHFNHLDENAEAIGKAFRNMLVNGSDRFILISQRDFITSLQKMDLAWERREWVMMLWARYCAVNLSENVRP